VVVLDGRERKGRVGKRQLLSFEYRRNEDLNERKGN
jgi:hypothetical protein